MQTYQIENDFLVVEVLDYGATITSIYVKKYDTDVVLGFFDVEKYKNEGKYIGQTVGRVANRIANGTFTLEDETYQLDINNDPNCLHGGINGLDTKMFKIIKESDRISCFYTMNDMDDGFPGDLDIIIHYILVDNGLEVRFEATTNKTTLCSLTNHSYFNLAGKGTIENHELYINADKVGEIDENGLTLETTFDVENTPFNFKKFKDIKTALASMHPQILLGKGLDHNYCLNTSGMRHKASLRMDDRLMKVYTDMENMHIYTGNFLHNQVGKNNETYIPRSGICFESQAYPNSINYENHNSPILKPKQKYVHRIRFVYE